jgi:HK97 family phage major capsid protein
MEPDEIAKLDRPKAEQELRERLEVVAGIRQRNGDSLVGLTGTDAELVREHMQSTNLLGERLDALKGQEADDERFTRMDAYLNEPDPERDHPGHGKGKATEQARDIGQLFIDSPAWKAFDSAGTLNVPAKMPLDSLFGRGFRGIGEIPGDQLRKQAALFDSAGFPTRQDIRTEMVDTLYQANNVGALLAQGSTDSDIIRYPVETVTSTGAAEVAEDGTKPEAQLSFVDVDEPVRTIAVLLPMTNRALKNQPFLRAYINNRLRLFVQMREDSQLLNGNGTAPNLRGILNRSGINTATSYSIGGADPDQALIDAVFKASMRVRDAFLEPDAVVMKPSTWESARLAKDDARNYLLGPAADDAPARLWGLSVTLNANMPAQVATNKVALVGAFRTAAMLIRRGSIELALSESHGTFFAENKVMLRAEEEVALAVFRPAGFATVTSAA